MMGLKDMPPMLQFSLSPASSLPLGLAGLMEVMKPCVQVGSWGKSRKIFRTSAGERVISIWVEIMFVVVWGLGLV